MACDWAVDLLWLPLGAGGHSVRLNGRVYEAVAAALQHRQPCDLYHSALEVRTPEARFVVEQAPALSHVAEDRGIVASGAVGSSRLGRFALFRYEVRLWRDGWIPDQSEAVGSPSRLSDRPERVRRVLEQAPRVPTPTWGRDELGAGEMWNSNSVIAWIIARAGIDARAVHPPAAGRAPGWRAGAEVAERHSPLPPGVM